jgi:hypothetical protein
MSPAEDEFSYILVFGLGEWFHFYVNSANRTDFCTFSTRSTGRRIAPEIIKINDNL